MTHCQQGQNISRTDNTPTAKQHLHHGERGKQLICSICSEDSTRWVLEKVNNYLISQESQMGLTLGVDQSFKQEEWITKEKVK